MDLKKQKENVETLLRLIKDNPELPILPMVATECVFSDDFAYWMGEWGSSRIDKYYLCDIGERVYQYSRDFCCLVDHWIDNNFEDFKNLSDEELRVKAEDIVNCYEWTEAIIVYIREL